MEDDEDDDDGSYLKLGINANIQTKHSNNLKRAMQRDITGKLIAASHCLNLPRNA